MKTLWQLCIVLIVSACTHEQLPYIGDQQIETRMVDGSMVTDTVYHTVVPFRFTNEDGKEFDSKGLDGEIYVANFFFTRCPSICPKIMANMDKVYNEYEGRNDFKIVSFTVDPANDDVERLKEYSNKFGYGRTDQWQLLTGEKEVLYDVAHKGFFSNASEDEFAPGGFLHSEFVFLVDREGHIRGLYDGTDDEETAKLIQDIEILYEEK